jgi:hypothetical protein
VKRKLQARVAKLEQTEQRSMIPTLTVLIHRKGCPASGACDNRCRLLINGIYSAREEKLECGA